MDKDVDLAARVNELESHLAHQEGIIQDLSDGIAKQWETIDMLVHSAALFKDQIASLEENVQTDQADKPPPHY